MSLAAVGIEHAGLSMADLQLSIFSLKLDTSYQAGGTVGLAAAAGLSPAKIVAVLPIDPGPYHLSYMPGTDKLRVFQSAGAAGAMVEPANNTNLSAVTVRLWIMATA